MKIDVIADKILTTDRILMEYVREKYSEKRNIRRSYKPCGVVIARKVKKSDGTFDVLIGYSQCNTKFDNFNRKLGIVKAYYNCIPLEKAIFYKVPTKVKPFFNKMIDCAHSYFGEKN